MIETIKAGWAKTYASFHGSETILWARAKLFIGTAMLAIMNSGADLSSIFSAKMMVVWQIACAWLMMDGGFSEYARRRNAADFDKPTIRTTDDAADGVE